MVHSSVVVNGEWHPQNSPSSQARKTGIAHTPSSPLTTAQPPLSPDLRAHAHLSVPAISTPRCRSATRSRSILRDSPLPPEPSPGATGPSHPSQQGDRSSFSSWTSLHVQPLPAPQAPHIPAPPLLSAHQATGAAAPERCHLLPTSGLPHVLLLPRPRPLLPSPLRTPRTLTEGSPRTLSQRPSRTALSGTAPAT